MSTATLTVQRDSVDPETFLISLTGFHYEGEGQIVDRYELMEWLGPITASAIADQLDTPKETP